MLGATAFAGGTGSCNPVRTPREWGKPLGGGRAAGLVFTTTLYPLCLRSGARQGDRGRDREALQAEAELRMENTTKSVIVSSATLCLSPGMHQPREGQQPAARAVFDPRAVPVLGNISSAREA